MLGSTHCSGEPPSGFRRLSRRDFLVAGATAAVAAGIPRSALAISEWVAPVQEFRAGALALPGVSSANARTGIDRFTTDFARWPPETRAAIRRIFDTLTGAEGETAVARRISDVERGATAQQALNIVDLYVPGERERLTAGNVDPKGSGA